MMLCRFALQVSQCLRYGAKVEQHGENISESKQYAMKLAEANKLKYINGYDYTTSVIIMEYSYDKPMSQAGLPQSDNVST